MKPHNKSKKLPVQWQQYCPKRHELLPPVITLSQDDEVSLSKPTTMTPEAQTLGIFREHYPAIPIKEEAHFFDNIKAISRYTVGLFNTEEYTDARKILELINDLYNGGAPKVRMGLENILFYDLGTWFACHADRRAYYCIVPENISDIITKQFISSSI
jgi:hypothetical protein